MNLFSLYRPDAPSVQTVVITALLLWLTMASAQIILNGTLQTDAKKPVPNTKVGVAGGPAPNTTDSKGQFSLRLPLDFIQGERVILIVQKKDWVINYPLDGEWNLPNLKLQNVQYIKVIIVPHGSMKLWTHARIEKYIALLSDEIARLKKEGDQPKPIDFSYFLEKWADEYDFTPDSVKAAFDRWAKNVKHTEDKRTKALREFYLKNFAVAAALFEEAALEDEADLKEKEEELHRKTLQAYANWKDAGNSISNLYRFEEALGNYEKASKRVPRERYAPEWAEIRNLIGITKQEIGLRIEGETASRLLQESEAAYREALQVYTREQLPQHWAMTQNNLGHALREQGIRTGGEEGQQLLAKAVAIFHAALQVRTRELLPKEWADTQINLGIALQEQGIRTGGEEGQQLLAKAVAIFRTALQVYIREQLAQQRAMTQNNLGVALQEQGIRTDGEAGQLLLSEAVETFRAALQVYRFILARNCRKSGRISRTIWGLRFLCRGAARPVKQANNCCRMRWWRIARRYR